MIKIIAVKLTPETLQYIIPSLASPVIQAKFAHALLTSAYNGENWYYVAGNPMDQDKIDYTRQIMTEEALNAKYDTIDETVEFHWFEVTPKQS